MGTPTRVNSTLTHQSGFTGVPVKCPVKFFWLVVSWLLWLLSTKSSTEDISRPTTKCLLAISKWITSLWLMVTTDGSHPVWLPQNTPMVVTHTKNRNKTGLQLMARVSKLMNVPVPSNFAQNINYLFLLTLL